MLGKCGDMAAQRSADWDSEMEMNTVEEVEECVDGPLTICNRGPLWVSVRAFLASDDVLHIRTTAVKWNIWAVRTLCRTVLG